MCGEVIGQEKNGRWLRLALSDGRIAWVASKYVELSQGNCDKPSPIDLQTKEIFESQCSCKQVLTDKKNRLSKADDILRIVTWNIKWFPEETDLEWLACTLEWLNADIIAVQEMLKTESAENAWDSIADILWGETGNDWKLILQNCGPDDKQHVGFIWNSSRVSLSNIQDRWEMNGAAKKGDDPCVGSLRPGKAAYVKSIEGGVDFHIVSVHLDSGPNKKDYNNREKIFPRIAALYSVLQKFEEDEDVIIAGDFNTMGCKAGCVKCCANETSSEAEISQVTKALSCSSPSFYLLKPNLKCSEYYKGDCALLDHFAVTMSMVENGEAKNSIPIVTGYCAVSGGVQLDQLKMPAAYHKLSDHCPVILDIKNIDLD